MTTSNLNAFFEPRGVAVIGASRDPVKLGYSVIRNLVNHEYGGHIYPVNRNVDKIMDLPVYKSVLDVPDPVDLAMIVVPAKVVAQVLEECGQRGIPAVTVVSGGFREVGSEGADREARLKEIAAKYNIALLGPNCIGTIDTHTPMNSTFVTGQPIPGEIALVSQSGAVAATIIDWAHSAGVGISRLVSMGNQAGVSSAQMLEAVARDAHTESIATYFEGVSNGPEFIETAARVSMQTPIVTLKVGHSSGGAKAVASHTGALAGSDAAYEAAFRRAGILRANSLEAMLDWARALAWQPLPRGNRVAVLTNAGGLGVATVDALEAEGMVLAPLTPETKSFLRRRVLPAASVENPIDILAGSGAGTYALCLDALLADETVDAVLVITAPQDWFAPVSVAEVVGDVANGPIGQGKPVMTAIMGIPVHGAGADVLNKRRIPNFSFPERLGPALAAMWKRRQWLDAQASEQDDTPVTVCEPETAGMILEAGMALLHDRIEKQGQAASDDGWMPGDQLNALLNAYCIEVPGMGLAPSVDDAVALAESIGYPVALKLSVPGVTHKSDVGGVRLHINSPGELRAAFDEMVAEAKARISGLSVIEGVTVQHMVSGGTEIIVGMVRDPQFGPLLMAGAGGTLVELARDVAFSLAPVNRVQANRLIDRTSARKLLDGYRGAAPADREAVIDVIVQIGQLALAHPEIAEVEINPLIVMEAGQGAYAVDARLRLSAEEGA